jgi:hypothetical protein
MFMMCLFVVQNGWMVLLGKLHRKAQEGQLFPDDPQDPRRISGGLERVLASLRKRQGMRPRMRM